MVTALSTMIDKLISATMYNVIDIFLDLRKAFDTVNETKAWYCNVLSWLKNYLTNTTERLA